MNISLIVMLGLPVLYLTGSLRQSVAAMKIGGKAFVGYFLIAAALSLIPKLTVFGIIVINIAGAFLCLAPIVYLAIRGGGYGYRFLLAGLVSVLLAVLAYYILTTYTVPYISQVTSAAVSIIALLFLGRHAPLRAPVLAGIYGISESLMSTLTGQTQFFRMFDLTELIVLCFLICFAVSAGIFHLRETGKAKAQSRKLAKQPDAGLSEQISAKVQEPKFPEFPEPNSPEPGKSKPEVPEPAFPEVDFPRPEPYISPRSGPSEG